MIPRQLALLAVLLLSAVAPAQTWLDDDARGDPGPHDPTVSDPLEDGSFEHPFDDLAEAIASIDPHDQILVQPGRYTGPGNRGIVTGKSFSLRSVRGADETIFDLEHVANFLTLDAPATFVAIDGLTIENGSGDGSGGIESLSTQTEILLLSSVLRGNAATGTGVAGGALTVRGALDCASTAFLWNTSAGKGGALAIASDSDNIVDHDIVLCTFRGNVAAEDGGAIWAEGTATIPLLVREAINCIFWDNVAVGGGQHQIGEEFPGNLEVLGSVVHGGWTGAGIDNFSFDPLFAFPASFHLSVGTPVLGLTGGLICTVGHVDADGQVRDCSSTELGADAVLPVTLAFGPDASGSRFDLAVAGATPGLTAFMLAGAKIQDPPIATPFGALDIPQDTLRVLPMPPVDADGTSVLGIDVGAVAPGTNLVFQAAVGAQLLPATTTQLP